MRYARMKIVIILEIGYYSFVPTTCTSNWSDQLQFLKQCIFIGFQMCNNKLYIYIYKHQEWKKTKQNVTVL